MQHWKVVLWWSSTVFQCNGKEADGFTTVVTSVGTFLALAAARLEAGTCKWVCFCCVTLFELALMQFPYSLDYRFYQMERIFGFGSPSLPTLQTIFTQKMHKGKKRVGEIQWSHRQYPVALSKRLVQIFGNDCAFLFKFKWTSQESNERMVGVCY